MEHASGCYPLPAAELPPLRAHVVEPEFQILAITTFARGWGAQRFLDVGRSDDHGGAWGGEGRGR